MPVIPTSTRTTTRRPNSLRRFEHEHVPLVTGYTNHRLHDTCDRLDLATCDMGWTCHDYLTIASFGEHWVSLKLANDWQDRIVECNITSALEDLLYDLDSSLIVQSVFKPTQTEKCWNIDLRLTSKCIACTLLRYASQARVLRHARKPHEHIIARRTATEVLPICRAPDV